MPLLPDPTRRRLARLRHGVRREVLMRRRWLAAGCVAVAVLAGLRATSPAPPPTVAVVVAASDLGAGHTLTPDDLTEVRVPPDARPAGLVPAPVGRVLAAPLRTGEPVTDVRVLGAGHAAAYAGRAVLPVRFPDADQVALLAVGDAVDVLAAPPRGGTARVVAADAVVAGLPEASPDGDLPGRLVLLAVPETALTAVSDAAAREYLTFAYVH